MKNYLSGFRKGSKSKTPDPCRPYPPNYTGYHAPPQQYYQHQAVQMPCPHLCQQPQQHIQTIQSPQQCHMQNQYGNILVSRPSNNALLINNQIQPQFNHGLTMPAFQSNQVQATVDDSQSLRYNDSLYSNQNLQQQQQYQLQHQHQQQAYQINEQNGRHSQPQHHQQQQFQVNEQNGRHSQPQQQYHAHEQNGRQSQPLHNHQQQRQQQLLHQQQYQNHQAVAEASNEEGNYSLEVLTIMYEREKEELSKTANIIAEELVELNKALEVIRKETPVYSVNEAKI